MKELTDSYFGMLPTTMIDSAYWDIAGKAVSSDLSDVRTKERLSRTSRSMFTIDNFDRLF